MARRASWSDEEKKELHRRLAAMYKVDLHRHLEGSIRPSTYIDLAPPEFQHLSREQLLNLYLIKQPSKDLSQCLEKFARTQALFSSEANIARISAEVVEDAFSDHIRVLELRYSPHYMCIGHSNLTIHSVHRAVVEGVTRAVKKCNIVVGLIGIIDRFMTVEQADEVVQFYIDNRDTFVGIDLANDELKYDSLPFVACFKRARDAGLRATAHSGECPVASAPLHVRESIDKLKAERIGHGIHVLKDEASVRLFAERGTIFEVCPTSNYLVSSVPSLADHPISEMIKKGLAVTINTDDPGLFGGFTLTDELVTAIIDCGLTEDQVRACQRQAFRASFVPSSLRRRYEAEFRAPSRVTTNNMNQITNNIDHHNTDNDTDNDNDNDDDDDEEEDKSDSNDNDEVEVISRDPKKRKESLSRSHSSKKGKASSSSRASGGSAVDSNESFTSTNIANGARASSSSSSSSSSSLSLRRSVNGTSHTNDNDDSKSNAIGRRRSSRVSIRNDEDEGNSAKPSRSSASSSSSLSRKDEKKVKSARTAALATVTKTESKSQKRPNSNNNKSNNHDNKSSGHNSNSNARRASRASLTNNDNDQTSNDVSSSVDTKAVGRARTAAALAARKASAAARRLAKSAAATTSDTHDNDHHNNNGNGNGVNDANGLQDVIVISQRGRRVARVTNGSHHDTTAPSTTPSATATAPVAVAVAVAVAARRTSRRISDPTKHGHHHHDHVNSDNDNNDDNDDGSNGIRTSGRHRHETNVAATSREQRRTRKRSRSTKGSSSSSSAVAAAAASLRPINDNDDNDNDNHTSSNTNDERRTRHRSRRSSE